MNIFRKKNMILMAYIASIISLTNTKIEASFSENIYVEESNFFVRTDLLYFKPHISGLELNFGTDYVSQVTEGDVLVTHEDELDVDPHFKWNSGYRVAAGYGTCDWEIGVIWTHFQDSGRHNSRENAATVNSGRCHFKLDQIDLGVAFNANLAPMFNLKPFIGVRAAKINQHLDASLVTDITLTSGTSVTETSTFDDRQVFRGIGPVFGIQGVWDLGCGFNLYGTAAASLLYGRHKVNFNDTSVFSAPISTSTFSLNTRRVHNFDWNIDLAVGINWQVCVCDSIELDMKLGFEHHQYFDYSHLSTRDGDLCLDGGVFSVGIKI